MSYRFFYKDLNAPDDSDQDLSQYFSLVNILPSLHPDNKNAIRSNPRALKSAADIIAATVSRIHTASPISDQVLEKYLECCHDILIKRNYREHQLHKVRDKLIAKDKRPIVNLVVGLGCQTKSLLVNRGKATAHVFTAINAANVGSTKVFFSGLKAAERKRSSVLEEFVVLEREFLAESRRILKLSPDDPLAMIDLSTEVKSESTKQNVEFLVNRKLLAQYRDVNVNIAVVSSNFHLIRVGQQIERVLRLKPAQEAMTKNRININKLILIGSESMHSHINVVREPAYVKSMVFEITQYFLSKKIVRY